MVSFWACTVVLGAVYLRALLKFLSLVNPPADIPLPTVQLLFKELKEVKGWYVFGVALAIPVRKLNEIQSSNPHDGVERWLVDMFEYWLSNNPDASWKDIIQVLEQTDQLVLAAQVKLKYLSPHATATTVGMLYVEKCSVKFFHASNFNVSIFSIEINNQCSNCYGLKKYRRCT